MHWPTIQALLDHLRHIAYLAGAPASTLGIDSAWWNRSYEAGSNERYLSADGEWQRFAIMAALALYDRPRATVLDLGCGTGRMVDFAQRYGATRYIGVDFSFSALETARAREMSEAGGALEVQWVQADLQAWEPTEEVDVVLISEVLYYLARQDELLDCALAALRPGGVLVVSMWNDGRRWFQWNAIKRATRRRGASLDAAATVHDHLPSWTIRRYTLPRRTPGA